MEKIWDPLRKKEVSLTPEEEVRQWFIGVLRGLGVPDHQMLSEVALPHGPSGKVWRADIVVYGRGGVKLAIVECKAPGVRLDAAVLEQALRYSTVFEVPYIFITNGNATFAFERGSQIRQLPTYDQMNR